MFPKQITEIIVGMGKIRWEIWTRCMVRAHGKNNIFVVDTNSKEQPIYECRLCGIRNLDENGNGGSYKINRDTPEWLLPPLTARERYENECAKGMHPKLRLVSDVRSIRNEWCGLCGTFIEHIESGESTTTHEFKPALLAELFPQKS